MADTETRDPKEYELAFLAKDEQGKEAVSGIVRRAGGEVLLEGPYERIPLSYPVAHETSAYFGYLHARLAPEAIVSLGHELSIAPGIIRHLLITPPFAKMRQRAPRPRPMASMVPPATTGGVRRVSESLPLSNEELSKRIEEILK